MAESPDPDVNGSTEVVTVDSSSTSTRKKRTIVVVRRPNKRQQHHDCDDDGPASPKRKTLLVSRRPRPSEGRLFENNSHTVHLGADGSGNAGDLPAHSGRNLKRHPDGRVLERRILGTAAAFEEVAYVERIHCWCCCVLQRVVLGEEYHVQHSNMCFSLLIL